MAIFYVDYENVHQDGLTGIETLSRADRVYVYCRREDIPRIRTFFSFTKTKATVSCRLVESTTKNALDFELLEDLFRDYRKGRICFIVSKDKGYDAAIRKGMRRGIICFRKQYIGDVCFDSYFAIYGENIEEIGICTHL